MSDYTHCASCGSEALTIISPATPGPDGWGYRCRACGLTYDLSAAVRREADALVAASMASTIRPNGNDVTLDISADDFEALVSELMYYGYVAMPPPGVDDSDIVAGSRCPTCHAEMEYRPFSKKPDAHPGGWRWSYRAFAVCPNGHGACEF